MREHYIKLKGIQFCDDVCSGLKNFEIRYNDRDYRDGDIIHFIPMDEAENKIEHPVSEKSYRIGYVLRGPSFGIPRDYCIFSITECTEKKGPNGIAIAALLFSINFFIGALLFALFLCVIS